MIQDPPKDLEESKGNAASEMLEKKRKNPKSSLEKSNLGSISQSHESPFKQ